MTRTRPSFSLLAYGSDQTCLLAATTEQRTELIAIGARMARLRLGHGADNSLRLGERCLLRIGDPLRDASAGKIPCRVAWLNGREAGVDFSARFDQSIHALQQRMDRGRLVRKEAA
jgi:hypothetical protein